MVQMSVVCLTWNCLSTWIFFTLFSTSKLAAYPGPKLKFPLSIPSWPNTLMINAGWPVTFNPEAWRLHTRWTEWMVVDHFTYPSSCAADCADVLLWWLRPLTLGECLRQTLQIRTRIVVDCQSHPCSEQTFRFSAISDNKDAETTEINLQVAIIAVPLL